MNPENNQTWSELARHAEHYLPADLSERVLARVGDFRRKRRELVAMSGTLTVCLIASALTFGWITYQKHQENIASWQELATYTQSMDRNL